MSHPPFPPPFTINPKSTHTQTIILLHGRNSTGHETGTDFLDLIPSSTTTTTTKNQTLQTLVPNTIKWILPNCPPLASIVFKEDLTQWFDIYSLTDPDKDVEIQIQGMRDSVRYLMGLIEMEAKLCESGRVWLGGISQGFVIVLLVVLMDGRFLRGVFGFCGWLPFRREIWGVVGKKSIGDGEGDGVGDAFEVREEVARVLASKLNIDIDTERKCDVVPVYLGHSVDDGVVNVQLGRDVSCVLRGLAYEVDWNEFADGEHWIQEPLGVDTLLEFFKRNGIYNDQGK